MSWLSRFFNLEKPAVEENTESFVPQTVSFGYSSGSSRMFEPPPMPELEPRPLEGLKDLELPALPSNGQDTKGDAPIPASDALRAFVRGVLPPQGAAQFVRDLRKTTGELSDFYISWTSFVWGDFVPTWLLKANSAEAEAEDRRRQGRREIAIDRTNGGNGHGSGK